MITLTVTVITATVTMITATVTMITATVTMITAFRPRAVIICHYTLPASFEI